MGAAIAPQPLGRAQFHAERYANNFLEKPPSTASLWRSPSSFCRVGQDEPGATDVAERRLLPSNVGYAVVFVHGVALQTLPHGPKTVNCRSNSVIFSIELSLSRITAWQLNLDHPFRGCWDSLSGRTRKLIVARLF